MKRLMSAGLACLMISILVAPVAAKGSGGNSIRVDQPVLHFGDTVTFTATVASTVKYETVRVSCSIDGIAVWSAESEDILIIQTGHLVTLKNHIGLTVAHNPGFVLGATYEPSLPNGWFSGPASCYADIFSFPSGGVIVSTTFEVAA